MDNDDNPTISDWVYVTSKNNQPRTRGQTNPHQGTDLRAIAGTEVYPIYKAKVVAIHNSPSQIASQLGGVVLQLDIDNDDIYDDHYIRYTHIIPDSKLVLNKEVTYEDLLGTVDEYKQWSPHLHIQAVTSSAANNTKKLFNYYRSVSAWQYGSHMDYISNDQYVSNNLYVTSYIKTTGPDGIYNPEKIELYYKIGSGGNWTKSSMSFTNIFPINYRWMINLKTATGATTGDTIYYYIVATRAGDPPDPSFTGSYKVGFWPQYFQRPSAPLSASNANIASTSFVIK